MHHRGVRRDLCRAPGARATLDGYGNIAIELGQEI